MALVRLVRHGHAAAGFSADHDPGLDDLGRAQAAAMADRAGPARPAADRRRARCGAPARPRPRSRQVWGSDRASSTTGWPRSRRRPTTSPSGARGCARPWPAPGPTSGRRPRGLARRARRRRSLALRRPTPWWSATSWPSTRSSGRATATTGSCTRRSTTARSRRSTPTAGRLVVVELGRSAIDRGALMTTSSTPRGRATRRRRGPTRATPSRSCFGDGALHQLTDLLRAVGVRRVMLVTTAGRAASDEGAPGGRGPSAGRWRRPSPRSARTCPTPTVQAAVRQARRDGVDGIVSFGGGSCADTARRCASSPSRSRARPGPSFADRPALPHVVDPHDLLGGRAHRRSSA